MGRDWSDSVYPGMIFVRLEIDHMRQQIIHAFHLRELDMQERLTQLLDEAIANFDFEGEVRRQAEKLFPELVEVALKDAIKRALNSSEVTSVTDILARQVIFKFFNQVGG